MKNTYTTGASLLFLCVCVYGSAYASSGKMESQDDTSPLLDACQAGKVTYPGSDTSPDPSVYHNDLLKALHKLKDDGVLQGEGVWKDHADGYDMTDYARSDVGDIGDGYYYHAWRKYSFLLLDVTLILERTDSAGKKSWAGVFSLDRDTLIDEVMCVVHGEDIVIELEDSNRDFHLYSQPSENKLGEPDETVHEVKDQKHLSKFIWRAKKSPVEPDQAYVVSFVAPNHPPRIEVFKVQVAPAP